MIKIGKLSIITALCLITMMILSSSVSGAASASVPCMKGPYVNIELEITNPEHRGGMALSPDGTRILYEHNDSFVIIDLGSYENVLALADDDVQQAENPCWSPEGTSFAISCKIKDTDVNCIRVYSASSGKELQTMYGHNSYISSISWSPEGNKLASGGADGSVRVWNVSSGHQLQLISGYYEYVEQVVAWSPDGLKLATQDGSLYDGSFRIRILDAETGEDRYEVKSDKVKRFISWSSDSRKILATDYDPNTGSGDAVSQWDILSGEEDWSFNVGLKGYAASLSPDGTKLAGDIGEGVVGVWNVETGELLFKIVTTGYYAKESYWSGSEVYGLGWSTDSEMLITSSEAGYAWIKTWLPWEDSDSDGKLNFEDDLPDDPTQQVDSDWDGYGDNPNGSNPDQFPDNPSQWNDSDGDGYGDNSLPASESDTFPDDASEWADSDGDTYGDNSDVFPNDESEWQDSDSDGFGDNSDLFPQDASEWSDFDGDGYGDNSDEFPEDPEEWKDSDGDGIGDNSDTMPNFDNGLMFKIVMALMIVIIIAIIAGVTLRMRRKRRSKRKR